MLVKIKQGVTMWCTNRMKDTFVLIIQRLYIQQFNETKPGVSICCNTFSTFRIFFTYIVKFFICTTSTFSFSFKNKMPSVQKVQKVASASKKDKKTKVAVVAAPVESSSSSSSSSSDSEAEVAAPVVATKASKKTKAAVVVAPVESSSSDSSDSEAEVATPVAKDTIAADSSSSSDSDNETAAPVAASKATDGASSSDSSSSSDSESEAPVKRASEESEAPAKKQKVEEEGEPIKSLFIGNLGWGVTIDDLHAVFGEYGTVLDARIATDPQTGRSRGFGYVDFDSADAAQKGLAATGMDLQGRNMNVDLATSRAKTGGAEGRREDAKTAPADCLFVGNLSFNSDENSLAEIFGEYGTVTEVRLPTDRETGRKKG